MLEAVKRLGELKLKRDKKSNLSILLDDPNKDGNCPKVLVADFVKKEGCLRYSKISIEDFSKNKIELYLYKRKSSRGPDYTLTSKITEVEKFFSNKIESWLKEHSNEASIFKELEKSIENDKQKIRKDLISSYSKLKSTLKKDQVCLYTIRIDSKYIGEIDEFKNLIMKLVKESFSKVVKKDHICCICGKKKSEVFGEALSDVFKFYTLDKPGYIAGGFDEKLAWRNAPICFDCLLYLREGKKYLDDFLKWKMGGNQYYLIPKFIFDTKETEDIIDVFFGYTSRPQETLQNKAIERITEDEKEILQVLGEFGDLLTYNFLFFESDNPQVFKINLLIEDILPSRISEIFKIKKEAENHQIFKNVEIRKNKYENIIFSFDLFKQFIPSKKQFLELVNQIFTGRSINSQTIFLCFMNKIREEFLKEKSSYLDILTLQAFLCLLFLKKLGILNEEKANKNKGGVFMDDLKKEIETFFDEYKNTFLTPVHKAVFLLGVLAKKLMIIQFQERSSTPFYKNFKGLRLEEEDFKSLLPKIINKLEEYKKNYYYSNLEELISLYFLEAGNGWKISNEELNFYFVLGMCLHKKVSEILKIEKEEQKDE